MRRLLTLLCTALLCAGLTFPRAGVARAFDPATDVPSNPGQLIDTLNHTPAEIAALALLPAVQDEVLIDFEQGDVHEPFIVGALDQAIARNLPDISTLRRLLGNLLVATGEPCIGDITGESGCVLTMSAFLREHQLDLANVIAAVVDESGRLHIVFVSAPVP
jgi:hypothetical protein